MSSIKNLVGNMYVSGQISAVDFDQIEALGISKIICNRPDGEAADQTDFATIASIANEKGIDITLIQIASPQSITAEIVSDFNAAIDTEVKTLAYCRTGTRSTWLWAFGQLAQNRPVKEVVEIAAKANYDLSALAHA